MTVVGILKADSVLDDLKHTHGDYSDMFTRILSTDAHPCEVKVYDVEHLEYPPELDACDGYLITGSKRSVYEDEPWIQQLGDFVQALHKARKKLVGICFGHQLVAQVLGGKTEKSDRGWGVGRHDTRLLMDLNAVAPAGTEFSLLSSHQDQVSQLPESAKILAQSAFCPIAGMLIGQHILTFQGHPEFDTAYARALLQIRREAVGEAKYEAAVSSMMQAPDQGRVADWILRFIEGDGAGSRP